MVDAYVPVLADFTYSNEELRAIQNAMTRPKPWDSVGHPEIAAIKNRIRDFHLERHNHHCCYCRLPMQGRGHFTIDREHILPKGKFDSLIFNIENLSSACKRCNMEYKKSSTKFVVEPETILDDHKNPARYLIVHPNFDLWDDHLRLFSCQVQNVTVVVVKVVGNSDKGEFTYRFFELENLTTDSIEKAQGNVVLRSEEKLILQAFCSRLNDNQRGAMP